MGDEHGANGLSKGLQGFLLALVVAEIELHEADDPNPFVALLDADALTDRASLALRSTTPVRDWLAKMRTGTTDHVLRRRVLPRGKSCRYGGSPESLREPFPAIRTPTWA